MAKWRRSKHSPNAYMNSQGAFWFILQGCFFVVVFPSKTLLLETTADGMLTQFPGWEQLCCTLFSLLLLLKQARVDWPRITSLTLSLMLLCCCSYVSTEIRSSREVMFSCNAKETFSPVSASFAFQSICYLMRMHSFLWLPSGIISPQFLGRGSVHSDGPTVPVLLLCATRYCLVYDHLCHLGYVASDSPEESKW